MILKYLSQKASTKKAILRLVKPEITQLNILGPLSLIDFYTNGWVIRNDLKLPSYVSDSVSLPIFKTSPDFEINLSKILKPGTYEQKTNLVYDDE